MIEALIFQSVFLLCEFRCFKQKQWNCFKKTNTQSKACMLGQHPLTQHPSLTAILETGGISPNISKQASKLSSFRALLLRQSVIKRQSSQGEAILSLSSERCYCLDLDRLPRCPCIKGLSLQTGRLARNLPKRGQMRSLLIIVTEPSSLFFPFAPFSQVSQGERLHLTRFRHDALPYQKAPKHPKQ